MYGPAIALNESTTETVSGQSIGAKAAGGRPRLRLLDIVSEFHFRGASIRSSPHLLRESTLHFEVANPRTGSQ